MAKNYPNGRLDELPGETVTEIIKSLSDLYQMGKPKTDAEVRDRIDKYFQFCEDSSIRPGIESLALSLSVTRATLFNWQRGEGCSRERQELIIKAKSYISAFIEQAMLNNRINPATSIFLLKNWCGYRDQIDVNNSVEGDKPEPRSTAADIAARHGGGSLERPKKPDLFGESCVE